jgi:hypothetical protein
MVVPFGEKLFGPISSPSHDTNLKRKILLLPNTLRIDPESEAIKLKMLRAAEEARQTPDSQTEVEEDARLIPAHAKPSTPKPTQFATRFHRARPDMVHRYSDSSLSERSAVTAPSLYSQTTGVPRKTTEPQIPIQPESELMDIYLEPRSRFSMSSGSDLGNTNGKKKKVKRSFWK